MLLDLPAWGISCVCWTSVKAESSLHPEGRTATNCCRNRVPDSCRVPETPPFALCPLPKKDVGIEMAPPPHPQHLLHRIQKRNVALPRPALLGNQVGAGYECRPTHCPDGLLCRLNNSPGSVDTEMKWGGGMRRERKAPFSLASDTTPQKCSRYFSVGDGLWSRIKEDNQQCTKKIKKIKPQWDWHQSQKDLTVTPMSHIF